MEERRVALGGIDFRLRLSRGVWHTAPVLHGVTATAATFSDVLGMVPPDRIIYNSDLRGHGRTGWSGEKAYDLQSYIDDARRILAEVTGPALIIGWSMGGAVGVLAAGHDPELVRGVLMAESSPFVGETEESWSELPYSTRGIGTRGGGTGHT
jgi:pimeloyl-ACP methyl ester carboxylesterase